MDRFDDMEFGINRANKKAEDLAHALKEIKIPCKATKADYEVDASVEISDKLHVQISIFGYYIPVTVHDGKFQYHEEIETTRYAVVRIQELYLQVQ